MTKLHIRKPTIEGLQFNAIVRGFIWALIITIILAVLFSLLLQYTSLSERLLSSYSTFIFFISMFLGATIGARAAGRKGLFHGLLIALLFWLITLSMGIIWNPGGISLLFVLKRLGYTLLAGVLGGVTGIGFSSK